MVHMQNQRYTVMYSCALDNFSRTLHLPLKQKNTDGEQLVGIDSLARGHDIKTLQGRWRPESQPSV